MPVRARSSEPKNFDQLVRSKKHRFLKLENLAARLNDLPKYRQRSVDATEETERNWNGELAKGWGLIEEILALGTLREQSARFTLLASSHPVFQRVTMRKVTERQSGSIQPVPSLSVPHSVCGHALDTLWDCYFHDQGWTRLRRCAVCQTWFVDPTDNRRKERCSAECTMVWWSRSRRKQAGHKLKR